MVADRRGSGPRGTDEVLPDHRVSGGLGTLIRRVLNAAVSELGELDGHAMHRVAVYQALLMPAEAAKRAAHRLAACENLSGLLSRGEKAPISWQHLGLHDVLERVGGVNGAGKGRLLSPCLLGGLTGQKGVLLQHYQPVRETCHLYGGVAEARLGSEVASKRRLAVRGP